MALDVDVGKPGEPGRQVPVPASEKLHRRGHDHGADDGRVDEERDGDPEAHLLEHDQVAPGKAGEDRDYDQRRPGDQTCRRADAEGDRVVVVAGLRVALANPAEQEHLVVHREAEEDGEEEERHPGLDDVDLLEAEELVAHALDEDEDE